MSLSHLIPHLIPKPPPRRRSWCDHWEHADTSTGWPSRDFLLACGLWLLLLLLHALVTGDANSAATAGSSQLLLSGPTFTVLVPMSLILIMLAHEAAEAETNTETETEKSSRSFSPEYCSECSCA